MYSCHHGKAVEHKLKKQSKPTKHSMHPLIGVQLLLSLVSMEIYYYPDFAKFRTFCEIFGALGALSCWRLGALIGTVAYPFLNLQKY